ncbi:ABC transporter substrate-binding protein (plasmid) [Sulfurospirillum sp. 'SP']|nr:ABC transporter substrate-binding protein [Sulfurospirillum sp. 'SP']WNZ00328.1 ABC transporter substrate-binding protein [Sulfurospirillum sp. 'SP']WNZ00381.1 ABC transporter substrate-binding protein [Sulfurospirillum sp. 'SP']
MKILWLVALLISSHLYALEIEDQNGNKIIFDKPFKRVISLYPAHTDLIDDLGAGALLIGVSIDLDNPDKFKDIPTYSYYDNAEKFISAKPDLILIRPMIANKFKGMIDLLKSRGIEVVSLQPSTYQELPTYWNKIGKLVGKEEASTRYVESFENEVAKIKAKVASIPSENKKGLFFETRHKDFLTTSPGSMPYTIIEILGVKNIAKDAKSIRNGSTVAPYGIEKILSHAQDIDVYIAQNGAMNRVSEEDIYNTPGFKAINAIKNKHVYLIPEEIVSRPTKKLLDGMWALGQIIYPNYFKERI